jgi:hypothetical protein
MTTHPSFLVGFRVATALASVAASLCASCNLVVRDGDYVVNDSTQLGGDIRDSSTDNRSPGPDASTDNSDSTRDAGATAVDANANSDAAALDDVSRPLVSDASSSDAAQPTRPNDASANAPADANADAPADANADAPADANADAKQRADSGQSNDAGGAKPPCTVCIEVYQRQDVAPTPPRELVLPFQLRNAGTAAINLSAITLRYYFTAEGCSPASFGGRCDGAQLNNGPAPCPGARVFALPAPKPTADAYIELSFADIVLPPTALPIYEASGASFPAGHECAFQQSNDYSYKASSTFVLAPNIAAYFNGVLVWGTEP